MKEVGGYVLIAIPFVAMVVIGWLMIGWRGVLVTLLAIGAILGLVFGGVYLITGDLF